MDSWTSLAAQASLGILPKKRREDLATSRRTATHVYSDGTVAPDPEKARAAEVQNQFGATHHNSKGLNVAVHSTPQASVQFSTTGRKCISEGSSGKGFLSISKHETATDKIINCDGSYGSKRVPPLTPQISLLTVFEDGVWQKNAGKNAGGKRCRVVASAEEREWLMEADSCRKRIAELQTKNKRCFDLYDPDVDGEGPPRVVCSGLTFDRYTTERQQQKPSDGARGRGGHCVSAGEEFPRTPNNLVGARLSESMSSGEQGNRKHAGSSTPRRVITERGVLSFFVDKREELLIPFFHGVPYAFITTLCPGDYMLAVDDTPALVVERKTDSDLAGGITGSSKSSLSSTSWNGQRVYRFREQREKLLALDLHPSRVVYLREDDDCKRHRGGMSYGVAPFGRNGKRGQWKPATVDSAMVNVEIRDGMRVRHSRGIAHTVFLLYRMILAFVKSGCEYVTGKRMDKENGVDTSGVLGQSGVQKFLQQPRMRPGRIAGNTTTSKEERETPRNFLEAALAAVPGMGVMAGAVADAFGSWDALWGKFASLSFDFEKCTGVLSELRATAESSSQLAARNNVAPGKSFRLGTAKAKRVLTLFGLSPGKQYACKAKTNSSTAGSVAVEKEVEQQHPSEDSDTNEECELEFKPLSTRKPHCPVTLPLPSKFTLRQKRTHEKEDITEYKQDRPAKKKRR